jgi:hypothetical protein
MEQAMPSPNDCLTLQAIFATVDAARAETEITWGAERLPLLVPEDMRVKFQRQRARLRAAIETAWDAGQVTGPQMQAVRDAADGMVRAYAKLADTAVEAGHRPLSVEVWETALRNGTVVAICRTNDEAAKVVHEGRYVAVWTLAEIANVIEALPDALAMAKTVWPGAKILPPAEAGPWSARGDAIPFGDPVERAA